MRKTATAVAVFSVVMLMAGPVMGATVDLANGYRIHENGETFANDPWVAGRYGGTGENSAALTFVLPDVGATVTGADLQLVLEKTSSMSDGTTFPASNQVADLFVRNGLRDADAVTDADFIPPDTTSTSATAPAGWTLIQAAMFDGTMGSNELVTLSSEGQGNLKSFINDQETYAGKVIVFGLGWRGPWSGNSRFEWGGANYDSGTDQLTLVPEPATMSLLGLGGLVALRRRRRA